MNAVERKAWGPVIKLARQVRGLTQVEVADKADITLPTLRGMEKSRNAPQEEVLKRVLHALGLIDDLSHPDVTEFLSRLRPLLGRIDSETRARLMPAIVAMVATALEAHEVATGVRTPEVSEAVEQQERARVAVEEEAWDQALVEPLHDQGVDVGELVDQVTVDLGVEPVDLEARRRARIAAEAHQAQDDEQKLSEPDAEISSAAAQEPVKQEQDNEA